MRLQSWLVAVLRRIVLSHRTLPWTSAGCPPYPDMSLQGGAPSCSALSPQGVCILALTDFAVACGCVRRSVAPPHHWLALRHKHRPGFGVWAHRQPGC